NTMAEQNVPAQPPTRTDEQIVPRSQWLTIGKSNLLFNAQKIQKNPIFQISVDILSNTNFFQALTASANVPAIYLQQFWKTMSYNEKTGVYSCQLDEQWFDLSADLLRKALAITPVNPTHPFELPPSGDTVIDFVNELGYPEPVEIVSSITGRNFILCINLGSKSTASQPCFDRKDFWHNNNIHRHPDSAVHHTGDNYILGNLKFVPKGESVKVFGMAIPDPLITEAIQQSSYYPKYLQMVAENTKKTPQGSASVQPATQRATPKKPTTTTPVKQTKPAPSPTKKPSKRKLPQKIRKGKPTFQLVDEEDEARQDDDPDLDLAKKLSLESHQEKGEEEGNDADLERAIKLSLDPTFLPQDRAPVGGVTIRDPVSEATPKLHEVFGKGSSCVTEEQVAHSLIDLSKKKRTTDQFILARRDQTPPDSTTGPSSQPNDETSEKVIHESSSTSDSERTESETEAAAPKGDQDQGEVDSSTVTSGVSIPVSVPEKAHEALAGPDPEPMKEDQTGSDSGKLHVSLAGPNPEHMDEEFLATAYPKVHENLKLITDDVHRDEQTESHSEFYVIRDHGREFDNEVQFGAFCDANGITHNFLAPRTPQSNGVVERKNRTLQEMARTMLNEQSIPQKFWCNAVDTSTYILNRILIRPFLGKTPYELFKGKKPSLEHFKVFGSKCFILNTKDYLTKFDPKSTEGVFLGYSPNSKAYTVLNKETMKVEESLNVKFDETPPPKSSPLVDDDILENDIIENQDKDLEIKENEPLNKEITNIKSSKDHPLGTVIGNLNERTLRSHVQNQRNFFCFVSFVEPKNIKEAIQDESWTMAMQEELNQFKTNNVWSLVPPPKNQTIIESIRILLAYACAHDFKLFQMDVKSAFLNSFINEEVCVAQPLGFVDFKKPNHVFKLKKALYGLKQAPKAWYDRLKAFLLDYLYTMGLVDNTLFTKKINSHIIIVQIYVDDIIFGSTYQELCDDFSKIMHDEFEMSMMGEWNFFLGLQIKQLEDGIFFNQSKYVKEMIKKFGLKNYKPIKTPMSSETKLTHDEDGESIDDTKYRGMIGSLLYLTTSRPNIMFSVCLCARFLEAPKIPTLKP
ncbi:retrovirus-related pol polyprotein from transposon TNT 1-94, partial [Tanacetum coccineum]